MRIFEKKENDKNILYGLRDLPKDTFDKRTRIENFNDSDMNIETIFSIFNALILPQWLLMIFAPKWRWTLRLANSYLIPLALAGAYAFLVLPNLFGGGQMPDFSTFEGIKNLFKMGNDEVVVGGWFHYLAFDLLVGTWVLTDSQKHQVNTIITSICIFCTLMAGPVGFLLYQLAKKVSSVQK